MRKYSSWAALAALTLAAAGCGDGDGNGEATELPSGGASLVVSVTASDAVAAAMSHVELTVEDAAATAATDTTGTTPAAITLPDGTAFTLTDLSQPLTLTGLPAGSLTLTARAYAPGASAPVAEASATVDVTDTATAAVVLRLTAAVEELLAVATLTASHAAPRNHDVVQLSATLSAAGAGDISYVWSDDCNGTFSDETAAAPTWTNFWVQDCVITVTVSQNGIAANASVELDMRLRPGTVERVAGTTCSRQGGAGWFDYGSSPLQGEDGPAVEAAFSEIYGLDLDADGNLVMAERAAGRILLLNVEDGTIHRIFGTAAGAITEAFDDALFGSGGEPATAATAYWLFDVAVDAAGNIFFVEAFADTARKLYASGATVERIFGDGGGGGVPGDGAFAPTSDLARPTGIGIGPDGRIYVQSHSSRRLYVVYPDGLTVETVATNVDNEDPISPADDFWDEGGMDVEVDSQSRPIVVERYEQRITRFDPATGDQTVLIGVHAYGDGPDVGTGLSTALASPMGIALDENDRLFVADTFNNKVRLLDTDGSVRTIAGPGISYVLGQPGPVNDAIVLPKDVEVDAAGNVYVAEKESCQVKKIAGPF